VIEWRKCEIYHCPQAVICRTWLRDLWSTSDITPPDESPGFLGGPYGEGAFCKPCDVAGDSTGNLCIVDARDRVQVLDFSGNLLRACGKNDSGDGRLTDPRDVAVDSPGNVQVYDSGGGAHRIRKYDSSCNFPLELVTRRCAEADTMRRSSAHL
jgi:hypothetical protein